MNNSKEYVTREDWRMRNDMDNAPMGVKLLLINPSGVLTIGKLTHATRDHFIEWSELPKRAVKSGQ